jgi:hypothetical protein
MLMLQMTARDTMSESFHDLSFFPQVGQVQNPELVKVPQNGLIHCPIVLPALTNREHKHSSGTSSSA